MMNEPVKIGRCLGLWVWLLVSFCLPLLAWAQDQGDDAYQAQVTVANTSQDARQQGFSDALSEVLASHGKDADQAMLDSADQYVEDYSYADADGGLALEVKFVPNSIDYLLDASSASASASHTDDQQLKSGMVSSSRVWISHISSAEDFARVVAALNKAPGAGHIHISEVEGDKLKFDLGASSAVMQLANNSAFRVEETSDIPVFAWQGSD